MAREFPRSWSTFFCPTYGCGATGGGSKLPNFRIFAHFPIQTRKKYLPVTNLQPRSYIQNDSDFSMW